MNICLYHGIDLDGFCSGAIYEKYMKETEQEYRLIPANYGWDLPWDDFVGANVTMIDFSFKAPEMERLVGIARSVTVIDHHKTAIAELEQFQEVAHLVMKTEYAGCELAWRHYFPLLKHIISPTVALLGRYDVWDHANPDVLPFQYGMRLYDLDPSKGADRGMWGDLLRLEWLGLMDNILHEGKTVLKYQTREDEIGAKAGCFDVEWEGLRWVAANRGGRGSQFFNSVWDESKYDGMMSFSWNGKDWTFGLYSTKPEVDCGAIAAKHGGGGHAGAAGFRAPVLDFVLFSKVVLCMTFPFGPTHAKRAMEELRLALGIQEKHADGPCRP